MKGLADIAALIRRLRTGADAADILDAADWLEDLAEVEETNRSLVKRGDHYKAEVERLRAALFRIELLPSYAPVQSAMSTARAALSQGAVKGAVSQTSVADSDELTTG